MADVPDIGTLQIMAATGLSQGLADQIWHAIGARYGLIGGQIEAWRGRVTATTLNVRAEPNVEADVVAKLATGTIVDVIGSYGEWYVLILPCGYCSKAYVEAAPL